MLLETQWYLFSIVFLFMAGYALLREAHVRVDILYSNVRPRTQAMIDLAGSILFLIPFCLVVIWLSRGFVGQSIAIWERSPDPGGLPRWPIKLAIPIAFGLLALQGISQAIKAAATLTGRGAAPDAPSGGRV
jgi:TRAP-type mannitol/chloroaromatic compound transport system permease small subunit